MFLLPLCRAEHRWVWADRRGRDAARFRRARTALPKTPLKPAGAQDQSGMGCRFFWILFFGQAKKSISAVGPRPDFKTGIAIAKQLKRKYFGQTYVRLR
ncbi:hypothetical protein A1507_05400 [Methylomonas koyamae]|uniref:Uncharacterized protein n=1 Tax=Methylomonas koyamae TaxID=702114 RepID=A0A177NQT5_9GAMM|nr:hypothetical protein A1507_05400 [Methylomonas koyamae]